MSDQPETLAAILAEMRAARNAAGDTTLVSSDWLNDWADRIEAAVERERDEDRQLAAIAESDEAFARCARCDRPERAPGDAAGLREALERAIDAIQAMIALYDEEHTAAVKNGATWKRSDTSEVDAIVEKARAALAAPARNCDRFKTAEEAVAAFADHLRAWENEHGVLSEYPDHHVQVPAGAFAWLFAPAGTMARLLNDARAAIGEGRL